MPLVSLIKDEVQAFKLNPNLIPRVDPRRTNSRESFWSLSICFFVLIVFSPPVEPLTVVLWH
jgi:hypothetical protein